MFVLELFSKGAMVPSEEGDTFRYDSAVSSFSIHAVFKFVPQCALHTLGYFCYESSYRTIALKNKLILKEKP